MKCVRVDREDQDREPQRDVRENPGLTKCLNAVVQARCQRG
jgi:hypothetical protein